MSVNIVEQQREAKLPLS